MDAARRWFQDFRAILTKDIKSTMRVKKYFFPVVIPPLVMLVVFSLLSISASPETMRVVVVDEDHTNYSNLMVDYVENISSEFAPWFEVTEVATYEEAQARLDSYQVLGLIYVPPGFGANVSSGVPGETGMLELEVQNINNDYVKNYIQRLDEAVLAFNQDLNVSAGHVDHFTILTQKTYLIGTDGTDVSAIRGIAVGLIALYGILAGLGFSAMNMAKEYDDETILEIVSSPVSRTAYIASKQLISVVFGLGITLVVGTIVYLIVGVPFRGNLAILILAFLLNTWFHANVGSLFGLAFKKITPVLILSILLAMLLWFFAGGFAPAKIMGNVVYTVSRGIPATYWTEIVFTESFAPNAVYAWERIGILGISALIMTVVTWTIVQRRGFRL